MGRRATGSDAAASVPRLRRRPDAARDARSPAADHASAGGQPPRERSTVYDRAMPRRRRKPAIAAACEERPSRCASAFLALLAAPILLCACDEARDTPAAPPAVETSTAPPAVPAAPLAAAPVQPRAQQPAPPIPELSRFVLVGTTISPHTSFAIVQDAASRRMYRLSPGDRLEGMLVRKVESSRVVMSIAEPGRDPASGTVTIEQKAAHAPTADARPLPAVVPGPAPQPYYVEPDEPPSNH